MFNSDALSEAIARAMATGDGDLVVDLQGVEFMAVATVRVILDAQQQLRRHSRAVVLRSPSACAQRALDLCGAAGLFDPNAAEGGGP
jgi:anti-anti-sigma factor